MYDEHGKSEFNKVVRHKGCSNVSYMRYHERLSAALVMLPVETRRSL